MFGVYLWKIWRPKTAWCPDDLYMLVMCLRDSSDTHRSIWHFKTDTEQSDTDCGRDCDRPASQNVFLLSTMETGDTSVAPFFIFLKGTVHPKLKSRYPLSIKDADGHSAEVLSSTKQQDSDEQLETVSWFILLLIKPGCYVFVKMSAQKINHSCVCVCCRMFLIRESQQHAQCFVLELCYKLKARHYLVIAVSPQRNILCNDLILSGNKKLQCISSLFILTVIILVSAVRRWRQEVLHHGRRPDALHRPPAAGGVPPNQQGHPARVPQTPLRLCSTMSPPLSFSVTSGPSRQV